MERLNDKQQVELIRQYKRLFAEKEATTSEQEALRLEKEAEAIKASVIEANLDLVDKMVRSQFGNYCEIADARSDAYFRLVQCFYNYDPDKTDFCFRHFLGKELKRFLNRKRVKLGINIPLSFHEVCNKVNIVYNQLCQEKKRFVSNQEVADALSLDVSKIESVLLSKSHKFSFDETLDDPTTGFHSWHETISSDEYNDPYNLTILHELAENMPEITESLPQNEQICLLFAYKMPYLAKNVLDEIANEHPKVKKRIQKVLPYLCFQVIFTFIVIQVFLKVLNLFTYFLMTFLK